ncbi:MAG: ribulokinase [Prevotella sp.]|jgi:L-ribulokinase|nr:ribulokinase [Prevotella sp.]
MEKEKKYVIGVDYGTDSCRAIIVDTTTGTEQASAVSHYNRWGKGLYCNPVNNQYRQHPADYIESLEDVIKHLFQKCPGEIVPKIIGMGFDTTGSTPVLLDKDGLPLALLPEYADNPNAMFVLWKDHTAINEAAEINELAKKWDIDFTSYSGGVYSSEWAWAKMLHVLRVDTSIRDKAYSWTEHCDWISALLTGNTNPENMLRSRCAAGHKAMWNESWGGLPSSEFLHTLDPLYDLFKGHLFKQTHTSDKVVGTLTDEWAERLGLHTGVVICVGELDCHMGAVGAQISEGAFVRIIGTSTCDIMVSSYDTMKDKLIAGICGQVDGSVIPGMIGLEAGQSAFGDIYAWFRNIIYHPLRDILSNLDIADSEFKQQLQEQIKDRILPYLNEEAQKIPVSESSPIALDWMNGRRTPFANQVVKGCIADLTLGSSAPVIYKALVEATAFGSKAIIDSFLAQGVEIKNVIGIGGIPLKAPFVMQTLADVLGMPIKVSGVEQACALGAAMFAAVAASEYACVEDAQAAMGKGFAYEYYPDAQKNAIYEKLYKKYLKIGGFIESSGN